MRVPNLSLLLSIGVAGYLCSVSNGFPLSPSHHLAQKSTSFTPIGFGNNKKSLTPIFAVSSIVDTVDNKLDTFIFDREEDDETGVFDDDDDDDVEAIELLDFEEALNCIEGEDLIAELDIVEALGREKYSQAAIQCETALRKLLSFHEDGCYDELFVGLGDQSPFCISIDAFNACLYAWSKSDNPDCGHRAEAILELMASLKDTGLEPNIVSFTWYVKDLQKL